MPKSERQTVTKTVTFSWVPDVYPLRWANTPDEVPIWDHSRGVPVGHNLWWARGQVDLEDEAGIIRKFREKLKDETWEPKAPPLHGYPRLVWATPLDTGYMGIPPSHELLNDLSRLVWDRTHGFDFSVSKRLQNEILELSQKYGPINDLDRPQANTYHEWLYWAYNVQAHVDAAGVVRDLGYAKLLEYLGDMDMRWRTDLNDSLNFLSSRASPYLALSFAHQPGARAFREEMARREFQRLSFGATTEIALNLGELIFHVPITRWLGLELAEMWLGRGTLKTCDGCGRLFVAHNRKADCCHRNCRKRKSYWKSRELAV